MDVKREDARISLAATAVQPLRRRLPKRWYAHVILIVAILITGFPVYYAAVVATQSNTQIFNYQLTPSTYLARNWNLVIYERHLPRYMVNSVIVALVMTTGKATLALLAGMAFVFFRFPGKWLIFGFVLITLMMPTEVMAIALFRLVGIRLQWGGYDAMVVPFIARNAIAALFVIQFRDWHLPVPPALFQYPGRAERGGADRRRQPAAVPVARADSHQLERHRRALRVLVIQFLYAWNQYLWPLMVVQESTLRPVQVGLRALRSGTETGDSLPAWNQWACAPCAAAPRPATALAR